MIRFVRALSPLTEFAIVVLGAFGYFILASFASMLSNKSHPAISEAHLLFLIVYEPSILISLCGLLYIRGWTPRKIGLHTLTPQMALVGIGLSIIAYCAYAALTTVATIVAPGMVTANRDLDFVSSDLTIASVLLASAINPIFEETFLCGYVITTLRERGDIATAINVSVGTRLLYHLYQGAFGAISIIPIGLVFAWWYVRSRQLWPIILAHAFFDIVGLLRFVVK
jgi:membrane protease YdiL (CAAX protease family)